MSAAMNKGWNRRDFLKTLSGAGLAMAMPASSYARIVGSNEKINVAIIGVGRQARGHLRNVLYDQPSAQLVQLCDVYRPNLAYALKVAGNVPTVEDFRHVLDNKDVDAVVIGSPDHWHAVQTIMACKAGKDVYVEKPAMTRIREGRRMVEAARKYDRIVQVGTQQHSGAHYAEVRDLVQRGDLGTVSMVRTFNWRSEYPGIGNPPDEQPPQDLNWDLWLGPAPERPYNHNRFGVYLDNAGNYTWWSTFRWFWDYAGGMMTDWGVHHLDIVQMVMGVDAPTSVTAMGGKFVLTDNRETPDTLIATLRYPKFVATYENRDTNTHLLDGNGYGIYFHGTKGTLFVDRAGYRIWPEGEQGTPAREVKATDQMGVKHMRHFLDSVKSRELPNNDIEIGHRSSTAALLANVSYRLGRTINWDREQEAVIDDPEAERLLVPQERGPWTLHL